MQTAFLAVLFSASFLFAFGFCEAKELRRFCRGDLELD
jgi:hypothetical protein